MLTRNELSKISRARLKDSEILFNSRRYDGAVYLCGYAIEIALKARICKTLRWHGYPLSRGEFQNFLSFKTHNLDVLLSLSGIERKIKTEYLTEWSAVTAWDPEARYKTIGSVTNKDAMLMIDSAKILLRIL